jgi:hypothetical protein
MYPRNVIPTWKAMLHKKDLGVAYLHHFKHGAKKDIRDESYVIVAMLIIMRVEMI